MLHPLLDNLEGIFELKKFFFRLNIQFNFYFFFTSSLLHATLKILPSTATISFILFIFISFSGFIFRSVHSFVYYFINQFLKFDNYDFLSYTIVYSLLYTDSYSSIHRNAFVVLFARKKLICNIEKSLKN